MARRKKAEEVVDGFTALRAAQLAAGKGIHPHKTSLTEPREVVGTASPVKGTDYERGEGKVRVGHTAKPARHDIVCYECGFVFFLAGQLKSTYCPKCRSVLEATELTINGDWSGSLKTIGLVRIAPDGVVKEGGRIAANSVTLEGRIEGGKVDIFGKLRLCPGGRFAPEAVTVSDLIVAHGAVLKLEKELSLKRIEIAGEVYGKVRTTGAVVVCPGGIMSGDIVGHHLIVEDGAIVHATVAITPRGADAGRQVSGSPGNWTAAESNRRSAA